jgi:hypothetical protein
MHLHVLQSKPSLGSVQCAARVICRIHIIVFLSRHRCHELVSINLRGPRNTQPRHVQSEPRKWLTEHGQTMAALLRLWRHALGQAQPSPESGPLTGIHGHELWHTL